jgi:hypothetical protein
MRPAIWRGVPKPLIIVPDPAHVGDRGGVLGSEPRISISFAHFGLLYLISAGWAYWSEDLTGIEQVSKSQVIR